MWCTLFCPPHTTCECRSFSYSSGNTSPLVRTPAPSALSFAGLDSTSCAPKESQHCLPSGIGAVRAYPIRDHEIRKILATPVICVVTQINNGRRPTQRDIGRQHRTQRHLVERIVLRRT